MVNMENAHVIEAAELKEIIEEESTNPTVERLMFIEVKSKDENPSKIFPCYMEAWGQEENAALLADPGLRFQCCIVQSMGGEFSMVRVVIMANELGVNKRIWDKPPTKGRREDTPWVAVEEGVQ